jgi:hypothetical protein
MFRLQRIVPVPALFEPVRRGLSEHAGKVFAAIVQQRVVLELSGAAQRARDAFCEYSCLQTA